MHKVAVGVLGASGYTGRELCSLVAAHPGLELAFAAANEQRGSTARFGGQELRFIATEDAPLQRAELVFTALPHGTSAPWVQRARDAGARVVDLSSDFRPGSDRGSGGTPVPYGLTELVRARLRDALLVANPGCYPTAVLIALAPLFAEGLVEQGGTISIVAASGVTGAGAAPRSDLMFAQVTEDFRAYSVGNTHRHLAEMRATVADMGGDADLVFTPHLLPVARGILATITVPLSARLPDVFAPWRAMYGAEPFVELSAEPPRLRDVVHRNVVQLSVAEARDVRRPTLTVFAAIDNLMKGAAGQAVQNANVVLGLPEPLGLPA
jgi:N-acetyl-gamma-glutamyl-phosphate reductase